MKNSGFTLLEAMIVVVIIAIAVTIALPSYENSIRKARRADAQKDLVEFAGIAERIFTETNSYSTIDDNPGPKPADSDYYTYTFPVAPTATVYTVRATPTALQDEDACGTMDLTQTGLRTYVYAGTLTGCRW